MRIASRSRIAPRQLMMPMAYAALISGMMTLVATSPNLVINYELIASGVDGFNFFAFTPFGVPILLASILYMHFARRWLRAETADDALAQGRPKMKKWVKRYQLADREYRVSVRPDSPLLGKTLEDLNLTSRTGARIILIERGVGRTRRLLARTPDTILQAGRCAAARPRSAGSGCGGAVRTVQGRPVAEFWTLFHRPFAGCRPGRGDSPGRFTLLAQNGRRGRTARPLRADGGRRSAAARPRASRTTCARRSSRSAIPCCWPVPGGPSASCRRTAATCWS